MMRCTLCFFDLLKYICIDKKQVTLVVLIHLFESYQNGGSLAFDRTA